MEAQRALREFVDEIECGAIVKNSSVTFDDYIDHFIEMREVSGEMTPMSLDTTKKRLKSISHLIGRLKLQEITPSALNSAYAALRKGNSVSGKKLTGHNSPKNTLDIYTHVNMDQQRQAMKEIQDAFE